MCCPFLKVKSLSRPLPVYPIFSLHQISTPPPLYEDMVTQSCLYERVLTVWGCVCVPKRVYLWVLQCHPNLENDLLKWNYVVPWPMADGMSCNLSSSWAVNKMWLAIIWLCCWYIIPPATSFLLLPLPRPIVDVLIKGWNFTDVVIWGQWAEHCGDGKWVVVSLGKGFMKQEGADGNVKCQKWLLISCKRVTVHPCVCVCVCCTVCKGVRSCTGWPKCTRLFKQLSDALIYVISTCVCECIGKSVRVQ